MGEQTTQTQTTIPDDVASFRARFRGGWHGRGCRWDDDTESEKNRSSNA